MPLVRAGRVRVGWLLTGALSVVTAGWGLVDPGIYLGVIASATRPGALSQDLISLAAGLALCGLAVPRTRAGPKTELVALGLLGYLFYAYGIYVIERVYNGWYLNYLAIFGLAAWLGVLGAVDVVHRTADRATLARRLSRVSAVGALLQPLIFYPLWISMLIPLMLHRDQIDSLYSIFILDLVFIMPAFLLVAVGLFRARSWAVLLAPVLFVLGAVLIFSLALGELVKPAFGSPITAAGVVPPTLLTVLFAALAILHLTGLTIGPGAQPSRQPGPAVQPTDNDPTSRNGQLGADRLDCAMANAAVGLLPGTDPPTPPAAPGPAHEAASPAGPLRADITPLVGVRRRPGADSHMVDASAPRNGEDHSDRRRDSRARCPAA